MKKINKKGFTLVELLLVIAIIGILAAVLFVSLGSQRERARITAFKEQMRALVPGITTCLDAPTGALTDPPAAGAAICDSSDVHGLYLAAASMNDCDGNGDYSGTLSVEADPVSAVADSAIEATCTTSDAGTDCVATCGAQGCQFADCE